MSMAQRRFALVAATGIALAGALAAGAAQARDADVRWSVTIGSPVVSYPVPVVTYPAPLPVYRTPMPVYYPAVPVHPGVHYRQPTYWDRDGDGIPNRRDPRYDPAWDRDGDGVPNRYDRYPDRQRGDWHQDDWRGRNEYRGRDGMRSDR